jgi:hypothetical protein
VNFYLGAVDSNPREFLPTWGDAPRKMPRVATLISSRLRQPSCDANGHGMTFQEPQWFTSAKASIVVCEEGKQKLAKKVLEMERLNLK